MTELELIEAFYDRLNGEDGHATPLQHDGSTVEAFTGSAPADEPAPFVVIGRPRTRGSETIDGVETPEVRLQVRIHTAFPPGKANHFRCYRIAESVHDLLEAAPLSIQGKEPYVPEPDKQPIPPYDKGDEQALDLSLQYTWPSL